MMTFFWSQEVQPNGLLAEPWAGKETAELFPVEFQGRFARILELASTPQASAELIEAGSVEKDQDSGRSVCMWISSAGTDPVSVERRAQEEIRLEWAGFSSASEVKPSLEHERDGPRFYSDRPKPEALPPPDESLMNGHDWQAVGMMLPVMQNLAEQLAQPVGLILSALVDEPGALEEPAARPMLLVLPGGQDEAVADRPMGFDVKETGTMDAQSAGVRFVVRIPQDESGLADASALRSVFHSLADGIAKAPDRDVPGVVSDKPAVDWLDARVMVQQDELVFWLPLQTTHQQGTEAGDSQDARPSFGGGDVAWEKAHPPGQAPSDGIADIFPVRKDIPVEIRLPMSDVKPSVLAGRESGSTAGKESVPVIESLPLSADVVERLHIEWVSVSDFGRAVPAVPKSLPVAVGIDPETGTLLLAVGKTGQPTNVLSEPEPKSGLPEGESRPSVFAIRETLPVPRPETQTFVDEKPAGQVFPTVRVEFHAPAPEGQVAVAQVLHSEPVRSEADSSPGGWVLKPVAAHTTGTMLDQLVQFSREPAHPEGGSRLWQSGVWQSVLLEPEHSLASPVKRQDAASGQPGTLSGFSEEQPLSTDAKPVVTPSMHDRAASVFTEELALSKGSVASSVGKSEEWSGVVEPFPADEVRISGVVKPELSEQSRESRIVAGQKQPVFSTEETSVLKPDRTPPPVRIDSDAGWESVPRQQPATVNPATTRSVASDLSLQLTSEPVFNPTPEAIDRIVPVQGKANAETMSGEAVEKGNPTTELFLAELNRGQGFQKPVRVTVQPVSLHSMGRAPDVSATVEGPMAEQLEMGPAQIIPASTGANERVIERPLTEAVFHHPVSSEQKPAMESVVRDVSFDSMRPVFVVQEGVQPDQSLSTAVSEEHGLSIESKSGRVPVVDKQPESVPIDGAAGFSVAERTRRVLPMEVGPDVVGLKPEERVVVTESLRAMQQKPGEPVVPFLDGLDLPSKRTTSGTEFTKETLLQQATAAANEPPSDTAEQMSLEETRRREVLYPEEALSDTAGRKREVTTAPQSSESDGKSSPLQPSAGMNATEPGGLATTARPGETVQQTAPPTPVEQLVQTVRTGLLEGRGEIQMQLSPDELGRLRIRISVEDGRVTARIVTETREARAMLESRLPDLRLALGEQGLKVQEVRLSQAGSFVGDELTGDAAFQFSRERQEFGHAQQESGFSGHARGPSGATVQEDLVGVSTTGSVRTATGRIDFRA